MSRTLSDYLAQAGVKTAATVKATEATTPKTAAPAKTAVPAIAKKAEGDIASSQLSAGEAHDGHAPRAKKDEAEKEDTDKEVGKTAQQIELSRIGIDVADSKIAEVLHAELVKKAVAEKYAELEKLAAEERARGALLYQGMIQENAAWNLATKQASLEEVALLANGLGVSVDSIVKRAEQIGGAMGSPALVGGMLGSAARTNNSTVMTAGEEAKSVIESRGVEAISGTRMPVSGADEKLKRFTDVATLPGNPGLNHGQAVDQGKGLGA